MPLVLNSTRKKWDLKGDDMKSFKENTRPGLSWTFGIAFIVFTGMGKIPIEAFIGIATATIIWWYKSRDEEKRVK